MATTPAGTKLGGYEVVKQLARGGNTDLLLGRARGIAGFERHAVIKMIRDDRADDAAFIMGFLTEARLAASLHHQNIVQVVDVGELGGRPYFAMEYVHGEDIRTLLAHLKKQGMRLPLEHAVTIVSAVAAALHHAHEQRSAQGMPLGIVHRDVTPGNVIVGYDGTTKVLDFGMAKAAITAVTQVGILKGKAPYMAPEQCDGRPVDPRTDVFALGIVLYEMVTLRRVFKAASDYETMRMIVSGSVPRPSSVRPDVPEELEAIILKAMARGPADRYQTAADMGQALETFARNAGMAISTTSLATYMQQQFEDRREPWLVDGEVWRELAADFDSSEQGLASLPQEAPKPTPRTPPKGLPSIVKPASAPVPAPPQTTSAAPKGQRKSKPTEDPFDEEVPTTIDASQKVDPPSPSVSAAFDAGAQESTEISSIPHAPAAKSSSSGSMKPTAFTIKSTADAAVVSGVTGRAGSGPVASVPATRPSKPPGRMSTPVYGSPSPKPSAAPKPTTGAGSGPVSSIAGSATAMPENAPSAPLSIAAPERREVFKSYAFSSGASNAAAAAARAPEIDESTIADDIAPSSDDPSIDGFPAPSSATFGASQDDVLGQRVPPSSGPPQASHAALLDPPAPPVIPADPPAAARGFAENAVRTAVSSPPPPPAMVIAATGGSQGDPTELVSPLPAPPSQRMSVPVERPVVVTARVVAPKRRRMLIAGGGGALVMLGVVVVKLASGGTSVPPAPDVKAARPAAAAASPPPTEPKPAETRPAEPPTESKPAEPKPAETKPAELPTETKPAEPPIEAKPVEPPVAPPRPVHKVVPHRPAVKHPPKPKPATKPAKTLTKPTKPPPQYDPDSLFLKKK